jgi:hypothetical protein
MHVLLPVGICGEVLVERRNVVGGHKHYCTKSQHEKQLAAHNNNNNNNNRHRRIKLDGMVLFRFEWTDGQPSARHFGRAVGFIVVDGDPFHFCQPKRAHWPACQDRYLSHYYWSRCFIMKIQIKTS